MKTFFSVALGALLLSAPAIAATPSSPAGLTAQSSEVVSVVSTPYIEHAGGSEQMPVFEYTAPAGEPADPVVVSAPQYAGGSEQAPVFNYRHGVSMTANVPGIARQGSLLPGDPTRFVDGNGGR